MAEEQIAEYQNDLKIVEQDLNSLMQQKINKGNELKIIETNIERLQGVAAYVRGKLNSQQVEEPTIVEEEPTISEE